MKKLAGLLLALVMCMSLSATAFAENNNVVPKDTFMAAVMAADDCEVRYTKDGSAKIITATISSDKVFATTRAAQNPMHNEGTASWNDPSELTFQCESGWGKNCRLVTTNEDSDINLEIEQVYDINGEDISTTETAKPGESKVTLIQSTNGTDLTCRIDITLTPSRGLSADWSFDGEQY